MSESEKKDSSSHEIWIKGFYLILFGIIGYVALFLIFAIAIFQFFSHVISGKPNQQLLSFGQSLSKYFHQITQFLTFNSLDRPFPFGTWPHPDPSALLKNNDAPK